MVKVITVAGTNALKENSWVDSNSYFWDMYKTELVPALEFPFLWSTDLDGADIISATFKKETMHTDWVAGGASLAFYLYTVPLEDRNIISHSHGRQVVLYCAARGIKLNNWLDISGPVRDDMIPVRESAKTSIKSHCHVYTYFDYTQFLGTLTDGRLSFEGKDKLANFNVKLPHSYGHSGLLHNPTLLPQIKSLGLIDFLREGKAPNELI